MMRIQTSSAIRSITVSAVIRKKDGRVINCGVISHNQKSIFGRVAYWLTRKFKGAF